MLDWQGRAPVAPASLHWPTDMSDEKQESPGALPAKATKAAAVPAKNQLLTISKLDAARRQLETVIRLYFSNGDPVAIHTLTDAAYNILRDITAKRGAEPMIVKDQVLDQVKPDHKKAIAKKVNEAANFFKHANRDHESTIDFNPEASELLLLDACAQYQKLTGEIPPLFIVSQTWFMAKHSDFFILPEEVKRILRTGGESALKMGRARFFSFMLTEAMKIGGK
jgi:hypothetical protein